jgi:3-keto-L-gulonate-6-phosphate decarboxylase
MNEQTKTHIEHANEIKQWKRSVDVRDRSIVILHNTIDKERKRIKAYQREVEKLKDQIIKLTSPNY